VVDQDPDPGHTVKPDRTVYLVVNASQPKMLNMPSLVNLSKRQAISVLEIVGLEGGRDAVPARPVHGLRGGPTLQGQPIPAETRIRRGESITLVLGQGQNGERVPVPDLRGMGYAEMKAVLNLASLNLGIVVEVKGCNTGCDTALATVERQSPDPPWGAPLRPAAWWTFGSPWTAPQRINLDAWKHVGNLHPDSHWGPLACVPQLVAQEIISPLHAIAARQRPAMLKEDGLNEVFLYDNTRCRPCR
jgi:hypothetical protein